MVQKGKTNERKRRRERVKTFHFPCNWISVSPATSTECVCECGKIARVYRLQSIFGMCLCAQSLSKCYVYLIHNVDGFKGEMFRLHTVKRGDRKWNSLKWHESIRTKLRSTFSHMQLSLNHYRMGPVNGCSLFLDAWNSAYDHNN